MMFKTKTIVPALLLALTTVCSCSSSDDVTDRALTETAALNTGEKTQVEFLLKTNNADGTAASRRASAEDSGEHTKGTADEYAVKSARVYLYDNTNKNFVAKADLQNITQIAAQDVVQGTFVVNPEDVYYKTEPVEVPTGIYDIFVVANSPAKTFDAATEDEFLATVDKETYQQALINTADLATNGIVMTNRAGDAATLKQTLKKLPNDEPTKIYVSLERAIARIDIAKSESAYGLFKDSDPGSLYATVSLTGYHIVNVPTQYYLFRHVAELTSLTEPAWDINTNFTDIPATNGYACDPYFFKKNPDAAAAAAFDNADGYYANFYNKVTPASISWTNFNATDGKANTAYLLENCMIAPAQLNGYSTGVIFKAQFKINRGEYTQSANNRIYTLNAGGKAVKYGHDEALPNEMIYFNYNFYTSEKALIAHLGIKAEDLYKIAYKKFALENGQYTSYYIYWVKHLDSPAYLNVMEFGIVRNNLYSLNVAKVLDLGSGLVSKGDTPDERLVSMEITLCVKPWIVRDQTNIEL